MLKKKIKIIKKILNFLYPNPVSNLYYINEYTLLISIILTARSKEKKVNEITKKLFNEIKSPYDVILLPIKDLEKKIKSIGLYKKKSKNIHNLSSILINYYNCKIPKNIFDLKKFPGVGQKTASVFMSIISNKNNIVFPIDTHISRMMLRWKLSKSKKIIDIENDAKFFFRKENWKKLHIQIINYGREYSPSHRWNIKKDIIYKELLDKNCL